MLIPKLGKYYLKRWTEEDMYVIDISERYHGYGEPPLDSDHEELDKESGWCRPLTERIISALADENFIPPVEELEDEALGQSYNIPTASEFETLEERIKEELRFIGLIDEDEVTGKKRKKKKKKRRKKRKKLK